MGNVSLLGHDAAWQAWRAATAGERMHHAWLLAGRKGLGKMHFARHAALQLVGPMPGSEAEFHPDIIVLDRLPKDDKEEKKREEGKPFEVKRNIAVDQVRSMQRRLTTRPTLGASRVVIIDAADDMEAGASNALLKSLEEPPQGTFFILIAHNPARLLPTIRSRCRVLRFASLSQDQIQFALSRESSGYSSASIEAASLAANGSIGAALELLDQDLGEIFTIMQEMVRQGDRAYGLRGKLVERLGAAKNRDTLRAVIELARAILADELRAATLESQAAIIEVHAKLVELSAAAPTYNFDNGLLIAEIGSLLARAAPASETNYA